MKHRHQSGGGFHRDDSSVERRPDSRQSDNMLPDLERFQDAASSTASAPHSRPHSRPSSAVRHTGGSSSIGAPTSSVTALDGGGGHGSARLRNVGVGGSSSSSRLVADTDTTVTMTTASRLNEATSSADVLEKRKKALQTVATEKQIVKEAKVTKKVISGWGEGPEFTYVIDRTGGALDSGSLQPSQPQTPKPPVRLKRGASPKSSGGVFRSRSKSKSKTSLHHQGGTEIRRIDFERDAPDSAVKKKPRLRTTACCKTS